MLGRDGTPMRMVRVDETVPHEANTLDSSTPDDESTLFSLEELGRAYADAIQSQTSLAHTDSNPPSEPQPASPVAIEQLDAPELLESDGVAVTTASIVEAILFRGNVEGEPIEADTILGMIRGLTHQELDSIVNEWNQIYRDDGHALLIVKSGSGYAFSIAQPWEHVKERFFGKIKETQLSQQAIDCLALIAYQPGITRAQIEHQWNQPAASVLSSLLKKGLIRTQSIEPGEETEGEPQPERQPHPSNNSAGVGYYTTDRFLDVAGIESLSDLPHSE